MSDKGGFMYDEDDGALSGGDDQPIELGGMLPMGGDDDGEDSLGSVPESADDVSEPPAMRKQTRQKSESEEEILISHDGEDSYIEDIEESKEKLPVAPKRGRPGRKKKDEQVAEEQSESLLGKRPPQEFDQYMQEMDLKKLTEEEFTSMNPNIELILKYNHKRRAKLYNSLTEEEQDRYNAQRECFGKEGNTVEKIKLFISQLTGPAPHIPNEVLQCISSAAKVHAGQLVEQAKKVQIQEIKEQIAQEYPNRHGQEFKQGGAPQFLVNGHCLSVEGQKELEKRVAKMGAALPHHMREARRQMLLNNQYIDDKPKSMFLRK